MAVTLNGTRNILFAAGEKRHKITLKSNDVYLTSPTCIMHGIEIPKLDEENASIALQLRALLPSNIASELYKNHTAQICTIICKLFEKYNDKLNLPSYEEYVSEYDELLKLSPKLESEKIKYTNKPIPKD